MNSRLRNLRMLGLLLLLVSVWLPASLAAAMSPLTPPPLIFKPYGIVVKGGIDAPPGIELSAWCGGVQYAVTTTESFNGDTWYAVEVPGDNTSTPAKEGCAIGETVVFKAEGVETDQTAPWSETNPRLDLTYNSPYLIYLPISLRPGSAAAPGTAIPALRTGRYGPN